MDPPSPVSRQGFEYYNDEFYALVHPNHRHRRSTIPELRAFFNSTSKKTSLTEKPAHWYRAQLIHYGLQPTYNKGAASMRLLDALNQDTLEVPSSVIQVERILKREYNDKKKKAKEKSTNASGSGRKQKLQTAKKRLSGLSGVDDDEDERATVADLATEGGSKKSGRLGFSISNFNFNVNVGGFGGPRKLANTMPTTYTAKPEPAIVQEMMEKRPSVNDDPESSQADTLHPPRLTLGLLNGSYKIDSYTTNTRNSGMILCLERTSIWGEFQLGCTEGILYMAERPWTVSYEDGDGYPFLWRARDLDTGLGIYGPQHAGEMRFLGNGSVDGMFYNFPDGEGGWLDCEFWGVRTSGRFDTRAPRNAVSMKMEYDSFLDWGGGFA